MGAAAADPPPPLSFPLLTEVPDESRAIDLHLSRLLPAWLKAVLNEGRKNRTLILECVIKVDRLSYVGHLSPILPSFHHDRYGECEVLIECQSCSVGVRIRVSWFRTNPIRYTLRRPYQNPNVNVVRWRGTERESDLIAITRLCVHVLTLSRRRAVRIRSLGLGLGFLLGLLSGLLLLLPLPFLPCLRLLT
jgi:hypothetical protein